MHSQEEDFVTNTYNRSLLGDMDMYDVREILVAARKMGRDLRDSISIDLVRALDCRLELRTAMLRALELAELRANPESLKLPWKQATYVWENVNQSHGLGKPVPEAFSTKLQRRLASTLPPRPIVQLSFEETYINFRGLLEDAIEVNNVLRYTDSQSLLVSAAPKVTLVDKISPRCRTSSWASTPRSHSRSSSYGALAKASCSRT